MSKSVYQEELECRLAAIVEPVVNEAGHELVELQYVRRSSNSLVRILLDQQGGITLDQCAEASRRISYVLEVEDPLEERYVLEVSSPGLDRALTSEADFRRKLGQTVKVFVKSSDSAVEIEGTIDKVEGESLCLTTTEGQRDIALADVVKGKIVY
jgi:ribosome maturation factor RimP